MNIIESPGENTPLIRSSTEIERRFLGKHSSLKLTGDSIRMTQFQLGSGEAEQIIGEFLGVLAFPYYARIARRYKEEIAALIEGIRPENSIKMRVRKLGDGSGFLTIKIRHGIQNGYKVYTERDMHMSRALIDLLMKDIGAGITPVKKRRYIIVGSDGNPWDIDLYEEENSFLLTGEREAKNTKETIVKPRGIGKEITIDPFWKPKLSTEGLQYNPISSWSDAMRKRLFSLMK